MKSADYYVNKRLRPPKAFFSWCYKQIPTIVFSNKKKTISSNRTGCKIINKRLTRNTKTTFFDCYKCFMIILCTPKRIEIQSYGFYSRYDNGFQNIECELVNFELLENDKHIQCSQNYYLKGHYQFGLCRQYSIAGPYTGVIAYENNIDERLKTISELKYINWIAPISIWDLRKFYKYRREIEFLQKINARKLTHELMYSSYLCDMRIMNEKWLRQHKHTIKNSNIGFEEIILEEKIRERNGKVIPGIENRISHVNFDKIPRCVGIVHFQNWVMKTNFDFKLYIDYLKLMEVCHVQINESNACPKDLFKAHQDMVELFNALEKERNEEEKRKRDEETRKKFEKLTKIRKRMEMKINGYVFILPKKASELVEEGTSLHHCVGTYVEKHTEGKTTIIFIRKAEEKDKPLYTMEFGGKDIVQIRAKYNENPPEKIFSIAEIWKEKVMHGRRA